MNNKGFNENKEFEERADYLEQEDLYKWTVDNEHFQLIQNKLLEKGAKLLVGPRGTGKTHQFRLAHYKCLNNKNLPLSIYVSFGKYYRLEPLLFKSSNAMNIFHAWVLSKIIFSCYEILEFIDEPDSNLLYSNILSKNEIKSFIQIAERYDSIPEFDELIRFISIQKVIEILNDLKDTLNKKRVLVFLDDAALTLTPDYMIEFFDIFRSLKTKSVSPKASVYPGTTQYGPRFHIGQDAEEVSAWLNVDSEEYQAFMLNLIQQRFNDITGIGNEIKLLLMNAAFGIPRAFISLMRDYLNNNGTTIQQKFNNVLSQRRALLKDEYLSLTLKLPQYKSIIEIGYDFFEKTIQEIYNANKENPKEKQITMGVLVEDSQAYREERMIRLLIEAGLLYKITEVKDGPNRVFNRYIPHFLFLIQNGTFSKTKGFNPKEMLEGIKKKTNKRPLRKQFSTILSEETLSRLKLDLPVCSQCGTARLTDDQKFCHNCGSPLVGQSAFESCLKISIDELPISLWQKEQIKEKTSFCILEDIIVSQSPAAELKKIKWIGSKRSDKIMQIINNILDEFLA